MRQQPGAATSNGVLDADLEALGWPGDTSLLPRAALDLREPLTVIIGGIETIRRHSEEMSWQDYDAVLSSMSQRAHRLAESFAGVFLAEQLHRGLEPEPEACPVLAVVRDAVEALLTRDEVGDVRFAGGMDAIAWCDRHVLRQLAAALLADAIGGGRTVTVWAETHPESIELCFRSVGSAVDEKHRAALEAGSYADLPLGLHVAVALASAVGARIDPYDSSDGSIVAVHLARPEA